MNKVIRYEYLKPEDRVQEFDEVIDITGKKYIKASNVFFGEKYSKAVNYNLKFWKTLKPRRPIFKRKIG